jgi:phosphinothricin acetyltransferase
MSTLRIARVEDAQGIAAIYAPIVRDTPISFEVEAPSADEMRRRIHTTLATHPWLVCAEGAHVRGYAYATRHRDRAAYRWSVDVAVYVHEAARARGVGAALYAALVPILVRQGFRRAYAGITLPNLASVALHESAGFGPIAVYPGVGWKLGAWHDVGWWGRTLAPEVEGPGEPELFAEVRGDAAVAAALADANRRFATAS